MSPSPAHFLLSLSGDYLCRAAVGPAGSHADKGVPYPSTALAGRVSHRATVHDTGAEYREREG